MADDHDDPPRGCGDEARPRPVTPGCCDAVRRHATVFLRLPEAFWRGDAGAAPSWLVRSWDRELDCASHAPAAGCPHCLAPAPAVERVPDAERPAPLCAPGRHEGYCGTCGERAGRFGSCKCLPPEFGWRPASLGVGEG